MIYIGSVLSKNNALILPNYDLTVHIVPIVACSCRLSFGVVEGSIIDSEINFKYNKKEQNQRLLANDSVLVI